MCDSNSMKGLRKHKLWFLATFFLVVGVLSMTAYGVDQCIGPLDIRSPVYAGTKVIAYEHGMAGCPVYVYADGKLVGQSEAVTCTGAGEVYLTRALKQGETITAKQDTNGYATWPQKAPKVEKLPSSLLLNGEKFKTPSILPPFVECQRGVRLEGLVEGARASVTCWGLSFTPSCSSGSNWTPYQGTFVGLEPELRAGEKLVARQDMDSAFPYASDDSTPQVVQGLPKALPSPIIVLDVDNDGVQDFIVGSNTITVCGLWVGALLKVYAVDQQNKWKVVGGGIATNICNFTHIETVKKDLKYCVRQSLCELESPKPTECVFASDSINVPVIREPLCEGDMEVIVDQTALGSAVWIQDSGKNDKGNATAPGATTVVPVNDGVPLKPGDMVCVKQNNASLDSGWSNIWVTVQSKNSPKCEKTPGPPPCTPGKGTAKLSRDSSVCQMFLVHAYTGNIGISGVKNAMLQRIINNSSDFRIDIVQVFNPKNPSGTGLFMCEQFGPKCDNTKVIATIQPNSSWNNINSSMYPFYSVRACLESVTGAAFPLTVDIDYEYDCK